MHFAHCSRCISINGWLKLHLTLPISVSECVGHEQNISVTFIEVHVVTFSVGNKRQKLGLEQTSTNCANTKLQIEFRFNNRETKQRSPLMKQFNFWKFVMMSINPIKLDLMLELVLVTINLHTFAPSAFSIQNSCMRVSRNRRAKNRSEIKYKPFFRLISKSLRWFMIISMFVLELRCSIILKSVIFSVL